MSGSRYQCWPYLAVNAEEAGGAGAAVDAGLVHVSTDAAVFTRIDTLLRLENKSYFENYTGFLKSIFPQE